MSIKGFTVHLDNGLRQGYGVCGAKAREFMGLRGLSRDLRRVTCPKCERLVRKSGSAK